MSNQTVNGFIERWAKASASERANSQLFLAELCDILEVKRPEPSPLGGYSFEYEITEQHADGTTSRGRIDLYKRGCFVLESKQFQAAKAEASQLEIAAIEAGVLQQKKSSQPTRGTEKWDDAMVKAKGQAERYIRALPASEPNPPFLITVDVGDTFEIFADFTQAGKAYLPFPDPRTFRIRLAQLADEKVRERLRQIWTEPQSLDPARRSADVTREISGHLAELAKSLEQVGHKPRVVADFLTRCLFCMFAEDIELIPKDSFTELLKSLPSDSSGFQEVVQKLFQELNTGTGYSVVLRKKLLQFNGGLFADDTVLPINGLQLGLLKQAAAQNWRNVEPAIFGTLLERALNPSERHKLGAHYTPRAYVERLVLPTVVEPLRAEWESVRAAALTHARAGKIKEAAAEINRFHDHLCQVKVLDPACGSGNFLYVALEHLKRLEGEVLDFATQFGESFKLELSTHAVDPHQFLGIEINPRAAAIAELVLWIGYLQWHFRTRGRTVMPEEPVLKSFKNIECRDAVLAYDGEPQPALGEDGKQITVWDGKSVKPDMLTGREVPDESKRVPLLTYCNPRPAMWPAADFIVGNPPYIGTALIRGEFGDGYAEVLRKAYPAVPESANFVSYWWHKAAELVRNENAVRFGLITTNALRQTFGSRIIAAQIHATPPLSLAFAIPDHPWVDTKDGAAVRVSLTVGAPGVRNGELLELTNEEPMDDGSAKVTFTTHVGKIAPDLSIGPDLTKCVELKANEGLANRGFCLFGDGFIVTEEQARGLGLGKVRGLERYVRPYRNGKDLTDKPRGVLVIDLFGLKAEEVREKFPATYQHVLNYVKPDRDQNKRESRRINWWIFGEPNKQLRQMLQGLRRYIATVETAKHRVFQFLDENITPDNKLVVIAVEDAHQLGVLSSRIHLVFSAPDAAGALLESRPVYVKSRCFDPFPFPDCDEKTKDRIRKIAEELDAHRKRVQAKNPNFTLTGIYNVLEKLRASEPLNNKDKQIHDAALVSVLRQLHDDLDAAVFAAYGWPTTLTDAEILERLVALNAERAKEESTGLIRYLRPDYQNPTGAKAQQTTLKVDTEKKKKEKAKKPAGKLPWPKKMSDRVKAVHTALSGIKDPITPEEMAKKFARADAADVAEILETLTTMGHAKHDKKNQKYLP